MSTSTYQQPEAVDLSTKVDDLITHSEKLEKDLAVIIDSIEELNKPVAKPTPRLVILTQLFLKSACSTKL